MEKGWPSSAAMRRTSITLLVSTLRGVLRHLHRSGKMPVDLAGTLRGPPMYALERIPSTISTPDVERVLQAAQHDHSLLGRRDYAIVMLLATYGLRASEITQLRLSDVDWRHERLHIRHSKTGAHSDLPLLRAPADAIIKYLRHARPVTKERAIFIRASAPDRALRSSSAVHAVVTRRLAAAGVVTTGKHGAHLLRHSRAVSLLRGGVALNVIGAVLGHRSARATAVYLKLATEDLRLVALEVPAQVAP